MRTSENFHHEVDEDEQTDKEPHEVTTGLLRNWCRIDIAKHRVDVDSTDNGTQDKKKNHGSS